MELYYEQNVVNNNIDEHAKKTKILSFAKTACIILAIFSFLSGAIFIGNNQALLIMIVFMSAAVPFAIAAFALGKINKKHNTEYDYMIDDEQIKISAVYFRKKRKPLYTIRLRTVESVGVFESDGYKKAAATASKKLLALVNYENEKSIVYILFNGEKGKQVLFIEPDRGFMMTLRRAITTFGIFDNSISEFERMLAIAEGPIKKPKYEEPSKDDNGDGQQ